MLLRLLLAAVLGAGLGACAHDVLRFASDDPDASTPRTDAAPEERGDAGVLTEDREDAGELSQADAGIPFPYRWDENGPGKESEEQVPITFKLDCLRDGERVSDCLMRCSYDGRDQGACRDTLEIKPLVGDHQLCVTVRPPEHDVAFAGREREQCVTWQTQPYRHPFMWQSSVPNRKSTTVEVSLTCAQEPVPGTESLVRSDCFFQCSIDHRPYADCAGSYRVENLAPGKHELRILACGPYGHEAEQVCRARVINFDLDADATPAYQPDDRPLPEYLEVSELGALGSLVEPYVSYAAECGAQGEPPEVHRYRIVQYLSYALGRAPQPPLDESIAYCREALELRPAVCLERPGLPGHYKDDIMLRAPLPSECRRGLFISSNPPGEPCLTHADCSEVCEYQTHWNEVQPPQGYCGVDWPAEEGVMCLTRGCREGLYCKGVCVLAGREGEACSIQREGTDCVAGLTCSGKPSLCQKPSARLGEHCEIPTDCLQGVCDEASERCVEASAP